MTYRDHLNLPEPVFTETIANIFQPVYAAGCPVAPKNFVLRNRTMALISDASIIVEAGDGSGSLHQGRETLRLGRPLFLCSAVLEDPSLVWPGKMLDYGARILYCPDDLLRFLPSGLEIADPFR